VVAEALLERGASEKAAGKDDAAIATLERAVRAADRAGLDEVRFAAWGELAFLIGEIRADRARGQEILDELTALADRLPPDPLRASSLLERTAAFHWTHGDYPACLDEATRSRALRAQADPDNLASLANVVNLIGICQERQRHLGEAMARFEETLALRRRALGEDHPDTAISYNNIASVARTLGDFATSERDHRRALAIRERVLGPMHRDTGQSHHNLANVLLSLHRPDEAFEHATQAHAIWVATVGPRTPLAATSTAVMGHAEKARGHLAEAERLYRLALEIRLEVRGPDHEDVIRVENDLASVLIEEHRVREAVELADDAWQRVVRRGERGADLAAAQVDRAEIVIADPDRRAAAIASAREACPQLAGDDYQVERADCLAFVAKQSK
jgi:tetratricopeptide (TPR) repeat protein